MSKIPCNVVRFCNSEHNENFIMIILNVCLLKLKIHYKQNIDFVIYVHVTEYSIFKWILHAQKAKICINQKIKSLK